MTGRGQHTPGSFLHKAGYFSLSASSRVHSRNIGLSISFVSVRILQTEIVGYCHGFHYCIMQNQNHQPHIEVFWEHVEDLEAGELLRQAIELILSDPQELYTEAHFDKGSLTELNEGVPAENTNQPN